MSEHSRRRNKRARRASARFQTTGQNVQSGKRTRSLRGDSPVRVLQTKAFEATVVEVDAISLTPPADSEPHVIAEPSEGFRIEIMDQKTKQWLPASCCLPKASDHKKRAQEIASAPSKQPVRVCKPGATRAVFRYN